MSDQPLWSPSPERVEATQVMAFLGETNRRHQSRLQTYRDLHAWSVQHPDLFWDQLWDFCGVIGEKGGRRAINLDAMPGATFFPDAKINFAENLLRRSDDRDALVFRGEDKRNGSADRSRNSPRWCHGCSRPSRRSGSGSAIAWPE